jgi:hypothetical protein
VPKPSRIFISHSHKDRALVERLTGVLDEHGLKYWYSQRHIRGAQQWHDEIGKALTKCTWLLLVLSPPAVASTWVKHELLFALEAKAYRDHILVLDYRKANHQKLSWTLHSVQWIDFRHGFDPGCRDLLRTWGLKHRSRRKPPHRKRRAS